MSKVFALFGCALLLIPLVALYALIDTTAFVFFADCVPGGVDELTSRVQLRLNDGSWRYGGGVCAFILFLEAAQLWNYSNYLSGNTKINPKSIAQNNPRLFVLLRARQYLLVFLVMGSIMIASHYFYVRKGILITSFFISLIIALRPPSYPLGTLMFDTLKFLNPPR